MSRRDIRIVLDARQPPPLTFRHRPGGPRLRGREGASVREPSRVRREIRVRPPRPPASISDRHHEQVFRSSPARQGVAHDSYRPKGTAYYDAVHSSASINEFPRKHSRAQPRRQSRLKKGPGVHLPLLEGRHAPELLRQGSARSSSTMRRISCSSWPRPITDVIVRRRRGSGSRRGRRLAPRLALGRGRPDAHVVASRKIAPSAALRFGSSRAHPGRDAHLARIIKPGVELGEARCATRRARASRRGRITGIALVV